MGIDQFCSYTGALLLLYGKNAEWTWSWQELHAVQRLWTSECVLVVYYVILTAVVLM